MSEMKEIPFWGEPVLQTDVAIVGGGLMGTGLAYHLANAGVDCALFERDLIGNAASGRNDGQIIQDTVDFYPRMKIRYGNDQARNFLRFKTKGQADLHSFLCENEVPEQVAYHRDGSLNLASNDAEQIQIETAIEELCKDGFQVEQLDRTEIEQKIGTDIFSMAKWNPLDATVNPLALTQWLVALAQAKGCRIYQKCPVHQINEESITHAGGTTRASIVILACNAYASLLMPWFDQKIFPVRGQVMATVPTGHEFPSIGCITNFGYDYWHWTPDGRFIIGGKRTVDEEGEKGFDHHTNPHVQKALRTFMEQMYPDMKTIATASQWSGIMGFSADGLPLIGPIGGDQSLWSVAGFTGYGLGLFWPVTKAVSETLIRKKTEGTEYLPGLSPSRFQ